jgi:hypothetical protein
MVRKEHIDLSKECKRAKLVRRYIYINSTELSRIKNIYNIRLIYPPRLYRVIEIFRVIVPN